MMIRHFARSGKYTKICQVGYGLRRGRPKAAGGDVRFWAPSCDWHPTQHVLSESSRLIRSLILDLVFERSVGCLSYIRPLLCEKPWKVFVSAEICVPDLPVLNGCLREPLSLFL